MKKTSLSAVAVQAAMFVLLSTASGRVMAQQAQLLSPQDELEVKSANERSTSESNILASGGPADKEGAGFGGGSEFVPPKFELSNEDSKVIGTMSLGYTRATSRFVEATTDATDIRASLLRIGLNVSAPFNGDGKDDAINFKHLGNDAKASFSLTWNSATYKTGGGYIRAVKQAFGQCLRDAVEPYVNSLDLKDRPAAQADAKATLAAYDKQAQRADLNQSAADIFEDIDGFPNFKPAAVQACGGDIGETYLLQTYGRKALGDEAYKVIAKDFINTGKMWFLGAQATAAYQTVQTFLLPIQFYLRALSPRQKKHEG